jgi:hypothetical protein
MDALPPRSASTPLPLFMLTGKHLQAYLAHAVLGRKLPHRERTGPRSGPSRQGPARDEDYKAWVRTMACCACGAEGRSEAAHTGTDGGMSMKASDYSCVPLCPDCHTRAPGAYHRIGKPAFEREQGLSFAVLATRLQREWRGKCA